MSYQSIAAANDWFARFYNESTGEEDYTPLVCWALDEDHKIVGLVAVGPVTMRVDNLKNFCEYMHVSELEFIE